MITWTTYGSWLQADERGFVKKGRIYPANKRLADSNRRNLNKYTVRLSHEHRRIVQYAIITKAGQLNQKIHAVSVSSNHVHIVAGYIPRPIGLIVRYYKNAAQVALRKVELTGRIWTKGFDKRYCFDRKTLKKRIDYVNSHNNENI